MCAHHWWQVPVDLRAAVWDAYRPGQELDNAPSEAWHLAAVAAIDAVEAIAAKATPPAPPKPLQLDLFGGAS
jgi:hypothetical protein